jgi:hypothetical protein
MPDSATVTGTVTLVQERRFLLLDDAARSHLFLLAPDASTEPSVVQRLAQTRRPISVTYRDASGLQARLAYALHFADDSLRDWKE